MRPPIFSTRVSTVVFIFVCLIAALAIGGNRAHLKETDHIYTTPPAAPFLSATKTRLAEPAPGDVPGAIFGVRRNYSYASRVIYSFGGVNNNPITGPPTWLLVPALNVSNVALAEGNAPGTTTFTFAVTLTEPAGPGGVTFDIATADGTAQDDNPTFEDNDYVAQSLTGQTIPMNSTGPYNFSVTVNRDNTGEPNETFFVNVTNITGAIPGDPQGQGTINNDDVTPIHDIQGPGASSPIVGATVIIRGIVTGVRADGFFVQVEDAEVDADPNTSEGIFVFTSGPPPAAAAFTAQVQVTGTVTEFVPSNDPQQPPLTRLTTPTTVQLAPPGQALPAAIPLTATLPDAGGPFDQLERLEGMRVSAASLTVTGPSEGGVNEPNNAGTSNGRFYGVITGVARPFREPGIQAPDAPPSGSIPPIPRWDSNPERLAIESGAINSQPVLTVRSNDTVSPVRGPLDYNSRAYVICPDGTAAATVTPGTLSTTVTTPTSREFTVASFNLFRFYDAVDDPATTDVVLTAGAYNDRLNKASLAVRNNLKFPDILGVQELENLTTLQDLATKINSDAVANAQPDPMYVAYLSEGNDATGIDVGFLVKTAPVPGGAPRVAVNSVTQQGAATTWIDPRDNTARLLNERPPLVLDAVVNRAPGISLSLVVVNNHLRARTGINSEAPDGLTTVGDRIRRSRLAQAQFLANYLQSRQTSNPAERVVVIGDFNAFEFNDGYTDVINTIVGTPPPDNQTVAPGDGIDLVNPDFVNLTNTISPPEHYSFVDAGNAQTLDHIIAGSRLVSDTTARRVEIARINADYSETERSNVSSPFRVSNHDPVIGIFEAFAPTAASVSISGRVITTEGRGVSKAIIVMTGANGEARYATTNPFGYFRFADVVVGQVCIFSVTDKRFSFTPQIRAILDSSNDLVFVAEP
jgi:uncharacterized protein